MLLAWKWKFPGALISPFALGAFAAVVHMNRYDVLASRASPATTHRIALRSV